MAQAFKAGITVVLLAAIITFVIQNAERVVGVEFLIWTWEAPRAVVLLAVFLIGILVGWLGRTMRRR